MSFLALPLAAEPLFYQDSKRGWFWYEDPPAKEAEADEDRPPANAPSLQAYTIEEIWDLHPDDFQSLLTAIHKEAVRRPTEANVLDYLTIQDIASRKASAFANVAGYVLQKHNVLDPNQSYPIARPGVDARVLQQGREIRDTIHNARVDHALLFFTNPDCLYCLEQRRILDYFVERYGWEIKTIDIRIRPDAAVRFNIQTTPTLVLVKRDGDYLPLAVGVVSLDEIERSLHRSIRLLRGEIAPEQFSVYDSEIGGPFDPESILINDRR